MTKRTQPAKITRPATTRAYRRIRLLRLLDEGRKAKAVWVCGPPGAGKTTLVSSYIESEKLPCLWYQVDPGDRDPATFFHYLGMGAKNLSSARKPLPRFAQEYAKDLSAFARNFFREFFSRVKTPSVMVFDNFQEVSDAAPATDARFHEMILEGLRDIPDGCHMIIITRNNPPKLFARNRANSEMKLIGWDDLRLTGTEAKEISRFWGYKLSGEETQSLARKADGWTAGLLLMSERAKKGVPGKEDSGRLAATAVFDYFMAEIFEKAAPRTRDLLLRTAFLPDMTAYMATSLSGDIEAGSLLAELSSRQFFVTRRAEKEAVYQFHPLFREFLLARAGETFPANELKDIKSRAANILLNSGHVEDAASLFIDAEDFRSLEGLILCHASAFFAQGRLKILESWLDAVPGDCVRTSPWLLYYRGLCKFPASPAEARESLEAAYMLFRGTDAPGAFLSWSAIVDTYMYEWKDFRPLDRWIDEFEGLMKRYREFPGPEEEFRATEAILSALIFRQPLNRKIRFWEGRAKKMMDESRDAARKISIGRNIILYYLWTGEITKAGAIVSSLAPGKRRGEYSLPHLMWLRSASLYSYYSAHFREGLAMVEEGLKLAEKTGIHLLDLMFLGQGVYNSTYLDDMEAAGGYFRKIRSALGEEACYESIYFHHQATLISLYRREFPLAVEHARETMRLIENAGAPLILIPYKYTLIYSLIEAGELNGIGLRIAELRKLCLMTKSAFHEASCLVLEALVCLRRGEEEKSAPLLGRALSARGATDMIFMPFFLRPTMAELLSAALENGVEEERVTKFIKDNNLDPPCDAAPAGWPCPVKIYTLGGFEIYRDGVLLGFERKAQQKVLDLLKAIISLGGKDVSSGELTDALWPDSEGDAGCRALATTLHRLRKLIGSDAVRCSEGKITLDDRRIWSDERHFDALLARADVLEEKGDTRGFSRSVEKALNLCKGPYLYGTSGPPCVMTRRERVRTKFIRYLIRLAEFIEKEGHYEEAAELYARGSRRTGLTKGSSER